MRIRTLSTFFLVVLLVSPSLASSKYLRAVQEAAKIYRVEVSTDDMRFTSDGKGGHDFHIDLRSNRNNFEMVMLVGYIAAGEATKTGVEPSQIYVTVDVPLGDGYRIMTVAKIEDVKKLLAGDINMPQFARIVTYL